MIRKNFSYSTVATAPSPATSGTSLTVQSGDGSKLTVGPATVWPASSQPTASNAEVVVITAISTDTLTIVRATQGSSARSVGIGDQIANTDTAASVVTYNVQEFGATGNGTTNDTTAINAAITAANTAGGGVVLFPSGTYLTSGGHLIYGNIRYDLGWSTLNLANSSNASVFITYNFSSNTGTNNTTDPANFAIVNGFINGNASHQTSGDGLQIYGHNYIIENLFITNCYGDGIYSEWGNVGTLTAPTYNMEAHFINVKSSSNGGWGLNIKGPHDSVFDDCTVYSNTTGNIQTSGNAAACRFFNCHEYLQTTVGVQFLAETCEWVNSVAEVTSPGVAVLLCGNECRITGGYVIDPEAGDSTGIQLGNASYTTPEDCFIDTVVQTTETSGIYFYGSGGYNTFRVKAFLEGGTLITGTPAATDHVEASSGSEIYGVAIGPLPQTNGSLNRMQLYDPNGTATWVKLGTWYSDNGAGGGDRLRIEILGAGSYNGDVASAGRTVIEASTGNGTPTPNVQGVWWTEGGNPLLSEVALKYNGNDTTWDVYVDLLAIYAGNCAVSVQCGTLPYNSTFVYDMATASSPGTASSTVAVLAQQVEFQSPAIFMTAMTVGGVVAHNGGTDTASTATASAPSFSTGVYKQLDTSQDVMLYIDVTTAHSITVYLSATSSGGTEIVSGTVAIGLISLRVPAGWYVAITDTIGDLSINMVTC